jgi:hypothetical protein
MKAIKTLKKEIEINTRSWKGFHINGLAESIL